MDDKEKTKHVIELLERRTALPPEGKPVDTRLDQVERLPWDIMFSTFNERHMRLAAQLFKILNDARDFNDFMNLAEDIRTSQNDDLFLYVLYVACLHRPDCRGVRMPAIEESNPHLFFAAETLHEAIQRSIHFPDQDHFLTNQKTAESTEPESKLAYYREDIAYNTHHWSWHVVYPTTWNSSEMGIIKDRKGELFYYMHQQMIARYTFERISNGMAKESSYENFREKLDGYSPHMTSETIGVHFGSRPKGLTLRDTRNVTVQDLELWKIRIYNAIDTRKVQDVNGRDISLDNVKGIDILGALVEASTDSVNRNFYGNLHNSGHVMIAEIHDPDGRQRELPSVMAFVETSPRDPIFYRWHTFINNTFQRHKARLTPYTRDELQIPGIKITRASVQSDETNVMETFLTEDYSDISNAPFLKTKQRIMVKYERLDHKPFFYTFEVENNGRTEKDVTFRVFLGPKRDAFGNILALNEQRGLMIEMDKFHHKLNPGKNFITRKSIESSVTISRRAHSFRELQSGQYNVEADYCTCGWPQHLLIPRGTPMGLECMLFVMCTDYATDIPDTGPRTRECDDAISYCGAKDQKYPDTKPMGYPFDRVISANTIANFLTNNMLVTDVSIKHLGILINTETTISVFMNI